MTNVTKMWTICLFAGSCAWAQGSSQLPATPAPDLRGALKVVLVEGDSARNIIKGKKVVRPIVEVRDSWGAPLVGAAVTFELPQGEPGASFAGGKKTSTVHTGSDGHATAGNMKPVGKGDFKIIIRASYRDQSGATTISQTNFKTAADARGAVKLPAYANAMSGATKALVIVGLAGAGAGIGYAAANRKADCSGLYNTFGSDLNRAANTPTNPPSTFIGNYQTMLNSLGAYCSCEGGLGKLASDASLAQSVRNVLRSGSNLGLGTPSSCGSF